MAGVISIRDRRDLLSGENICNTQQFVTLSKFTERERTCLPRDIHNSRHSQLSDSAELQASKHYYKQTLYHESKLITSQSSAAFAIAANIPHQLFQLHITDDAPLGTSNYITTH
jgi:hypothetical protein